MRGLIFYEKPGCMSNARQRHLLRDQGFTLEVRDLLTEPWSAERLRPFFGERPLVEWFNPTAPAIKRGEIDPTRLSADAALAAMVADPLLIRRPLIESELGRLCGFAPHPLFRQLGVVLEADQDLQACSKQGVAMPRCDAPAVRESLS